MIKSMTGYGKLVTALPGKTITIELKTLNSKGLDVNLRIPSWLRGKEMEIRGMLTSLQRGKTDLCITSETAMSDAGFSINKPLIREYHTTLLALQQELNEEATPLLPLILRLPDIFSSGQQEVDPGEWELIRSGVDEVIKATNHYREEEGSALKQDIFHRTEQILRLLRQIAPLEPLRKERIRETLIRELQQLSGSDGKGSADPNRFEQELIYYLEKMDFTEEKIRLIQHCEYFTSTMDEPDSQGKKLGFISQEMGREINTLGSKASDAAIQHLVVQMKDELEKIKEQLLNVL